MLILGLNSFHADSAAVILRDGKLVAAAEEERFRRVKHWAGFPSDAIRYCLKEAGARVSDISHVALNQDNRSNLLRKMGFVLKNQPSLSLIMERVKNRTARQNLASLLDRIDPTSKFRGKIEHVEHHIAHLESAFSVSPFNHAVVVSVDGFGDFASAAWGVGQEGQISVDGRTYFPHSLGIFYQAITQFLGFPHYGDEYKVMGLAPYGRPRWLSDMRKIVTLLAGGSFELALPYFRHHKSPVAFEWRDGSPEFAALYSPALEELLGPHRESKQPLETRHHDIAASAQAMYEEAFFHLLNTLFAKYQLEEVCLAGGCAMNSVANGKIRRLTPFRRVYVQSAAGDAGGALGAALAVWKAKTGKREFVMNHAYWGPAYSDSDIRALMRNNAWRLERSDFAVREIEGEPELCRITAEDIADGRVVGWFQGRMEWGPRALGNRSIVCDPRRSDMKAILNAKIKRRESFRPFAPSILQEAVGDWFEEDDDVPFMMQVYSIREEKRSQIPAVCHVDGSGRLQTVYKDTNPRYHHLISKFRDLTGVPMVLNTSFNENEPVVCRPEEALECFCRTGMDTLVLGNIMIRRN